MSSLEIPTQSNSTPPSKTCSHTDAGATGRASRPPRGPAALTDATNDLLPEKQAALHELAIPLILIQEHLRTIRKGLEEEAAREEVIRSRPDAGSDALEADGADGSFPSRREAVCVA